MTVPVGSQNGSLQRVRAGAVVLATDGFAASPSLMARFCGDLGEPFYGGGSTSTGDAIGGLSRVGAGFRNMGACLRSGLVVVGHGTRVSPALQFNGAVLVNTDGERFLDEAAHGDSSRAGTLPGAAGGRVQARDPAGAAGRAGGDGVGRRGDDGHPRVGDDARLPVGRRDPGP